MEAYAGSLLSAFGLDEFVVDYECLCYKFSVNDNLLSYAIASMLIVFFASFR